MIDNLYSIHDKNNFYLGLISQVFKDYSIVQVENLSWLKFRKLNDELIISNTTNIYVVVDALSGLFLGEISHSRLPNSDSVHNALIKDDSGKIFPELRIDIVGYMPKGKSKFMLSGFQNVGLTNPVYLANKGVIDKYLKSVETSDKEEVRLSPFAKFSNLPSKGLELKPSTLFDRHLMCVGMTNSGKSTTALSILDKLIISNKKVLIIDPTGEYENSFLESSNVVKLKLGIDTILDPGSVSFSQWATLFETNDSTQPAVLADAIKSLRYQYSKDIHEPYKKEGKTPDAVEKDMASLGPTDSSFDLTLLPAQIVEEAVELDIKNSGKYKKVVFQFNQKQWLVQKVTHKLSNTRLSEFFLDDKSKKNNLIEKIDEFLSEKVHSLYINTSTIGSSEGIGGMIIDLLSSYILDNKEKNETAFVLFIDEVHRYSRSMKENNYQIGLSSIAREGRKKGIFLFLTTQNPQDVPKELLGQIGTFFVHRLTHTNEIEAIKNHLSEKSIKLIPNLNRGEAVLTSVNLIQDLYVEMIKCSRNHDNSTPML
jgi:hypothetical protein